MHPSIIALLPLVVLASALPFNPLYCNCGLGCGEDVCGNTKTSCAPLVVRPMEVPKPVLPVPKIVCAPVGGVPPLIPLSSPCDCYTSIVKPATIPKPACTVCQGAINYSQNQQLTLSQQQQLLFGGSCAGAGAGGDVLLTSSGGRPIMVDEVIAPSNPAYTIPADAVSLSIAYKQANEACHINEDRLAFGFRTMPKDMPIYQRKRVNNIPEGDLLSLNGQIVELKKIACGKTQSLDEEAAEDLLSLAEDEEEAAAEESNFKRVSLGEIGYKPAKIQSATFVDVPAASVTGLVEDLIGSAGAGAACNDGFKPGNVLITQIPKLDAMSMPLPFPQPCPPCEGEAPIPPVPVLPPGYNSPYAYYSNGAASSSSSNSCSHSVMMQSLGAGGCQ